MACPRPARRCTASGRTCRRWCGTESPTALAADWGVWGATLGGGEYVARSALGQDAAGDLVYAASMSATPADLASVLAYAGAQTAMELDINPEWVQLDVASRPGGPLRAAIHGQDRPADQFLVGWARDFIAVLGPARRGPVTPGAGGGGAQVAHWQDRTSTRI